MISAVTHWVHNTIAKTWPRPSLTNLRFQQIRGIQRHRAVTSGVWEAFTRQGSLARPGHADHLWVLDLLGHVRVEDRIRRSWFWARLHIRYTRSGPTPPADPPPCCSTRARRVAVADRTGLLSYPLGRVLSTMDGALSDRLCRRSRDMYGRRDVTGGSASGLTELVAGPQVVVGRVVMTRSTWRNRKSCSPRPELSGAGWRCLRIRCDHALSDRVSCSGASRQKLA